MRAGALRHYATIQNGTESQSSSGESTLTWSTYQKVWMSIEPASGREFFASDQLNAVMSHKVKTRFIDGVTTKMRILYGTRVFEILSIVNIREIGHEMILMCKEDV